MNETTAGLLLSYAAVFSAAMLFVIATELVSIRRAIEKAVARMDSRT